MNNKAFKMRKTTLLLALIYLFLSSHIYMMIGMERHALEHAHHASHAAQHAFSLCAWMCGTSTFVNSTNLNLNQHYDSSFGNLAVYIEPSFDNLLTFDLHGRSPPVLFL